MNKKIAIFTIEIVARELVSKLLLAQVLAKSGALVYVGSFSAVEQLEYKVRSSVILHKSTLFRKVQRYNKSLGAIVTVLDEEAGYANPLSRLSDFCSARYGSVTADLYPIVFALNDDYKRSMERLPNFKSVRVVTTGWPREDIWRFVSRSLYKQEAQMLFGKYGKLFLFVSSFGFVTRAQFEKRIERYKDEFNKKRRAQRYHDLQEHLAMLREVAANLKGDETLVVRPHPSESVSSWRSLFKGTKNVIIDGRYDISPWLLAATGVFGYQSTASVEANYYNRKFYTFRAKVIPGVNDTIAAQKSTNVNSISDLLEALRSGNPANDTSDQLQLNTTGELASEKIARELLTFDVKPQPAVKFGFGDRLKYFVALAKKRTRIFLKNLRSSEPPLKRSEFEKLGRGIKASDIRAMLPHICPALGIDPEFVIVKQELKNLVRIELKDL